MTSHLMNTYPRQAVAFTRGEGVWLWDTTGKRYLDALAGVAVMSLGHSHPELTQVIQMQASQLMHVSNGFQIPEQTALADRLAELSGMDTAFFSNSGAEANETAIKMARYYGHQKGFKVPTLVVMDKAFHGRTMATITASAGEKVRGGFEPLLEGFIRCPFNDLKALRDIFSTHKDVVGVMVEPVQGEGGIYVPDNSYLPGVRALCDEFGVLMILDEIQTGMGRTGQFLAYQHSKILPDIVTLAKALGNGYPIGACLARGALAQLLPPGSHGSTFGGSPMASKIALTVLNILTRDRLAEHAATVGEYLLRQLQKALHKAPHVVAIRGQGLMIGIELDHDCTALRAAGLALPDIGLAFNVTAQKVVRLVPPLILQKSEADLLVKLLAPLILASKPKAA